MAGKEKVIPILTSVSLFSIITVIFSSIKYYVSESSYPPDKSTSLTITVLYVVLAIVIQLSINLLNTKRLCSTRPLGALVHTFLPNALIFIAVLMIIRNKPGWLRPFSNTIGYGIIALFNDLKWLSDLATKDKDKTLIKKDNSLFLNELTPSNFTSLVKEMHNNDLITFSEKQSASTSNLEKSMIGGSRRKYNKKIQKGGAYDSSEEPVVMSDPIAVEQPVVDNMGTKTQVKGAGIKQNKSKKEEVLPNELIENKLLQKLWSLVSMKSIISECTWFLLCGILVLAYSYNGILNLSCTYTLEQQKERNKKREEKITEFESKKTKSVKV